MYGMTEHLINTHLLVLRSRSSVKLKVIYQGYISQKIAVSGAFVFHKYILFSIALLLRNLISKFITCVQCQNVLFVYEEKHIKPEDKNEGHLANVSVFMPPHRKIRGI